VARVIDSVTWNGKRFGVKTANVHVDALIGGSIWMCPGIIYLLVLGRDLPGFEDGSRFPLDPGARSRCA